MTTYTLIDAQDVVMDRGLSITDAAREILTYDGHDYQIRIENGKYCLFCSQGSRHTSWGLKNYSQSFVFGKTVAVDATSESEAFEKIAAMIINHDWVRVPTAITDADYDKQEADFAAENSDEDLN